MKRIILYVELSKEEYGGILTKVLIDKSMADSNALFAIQWFCWWVWFIVIVLYTKANDISAMEATITRIVCQVVDENAAIVKYALHMNSEPKACWVLLLTTEKWNLFTFLRSPDYKTNNSWHYCWRKINQFMSSNVSQRSSCRWINDAITDFWNHANVSSII